MYILKRKYSSVEFVLSNFIQSDLIKTIIIECHCIKRKNHLELTIISQETQNLYIISIKHFCM